MPDRSVIPAHDPPLLRERLAFHPFEIAVATLGVIAGVLLLWGLVLGTVIARPVEALPPVLAVTIPGLLGGGGLAVIVALTWRGRHVTTEWAMERVGWCAGALGWACYGVTVLARWPESLWTLAICLTFVGGSLLRVWAVTVVARRTRAAVQEVAE